MNSRSIIIFLISFTAIITSFTSLISCKHDPLIPVDIYTVCFEEQVLPVLQTSCGISGCHDAATASEGFVAESYESVINAVNPGDAKGSLLYTVITENEQEDRMPPPPFSTLSSKQKELFYIWITQGAINSDCPETSCDTAAAIEYSTQVWPVIENNCLSCHNSSLSSGGVNLDGYQQIKNFSETLRNGTPVIVGVINYMNGFANMPPSKKLDNCTIRIIKLWVEQGILNN